MATSGTANMLERLRGMRFDRIEPDKGCHSSQIVLVVRRLSGEVRGT